MLIRKPNDIPSSEITPESVYINRRHFIGKTAGIALGGVAGAGAIGGAIAGRPGRAAAQTAQVGQRDWSAVRTELGEELNSFEDVTTYNNFYEFGTQKEDPARNAHTLRPRPWTIEVGGMCANPGVYGLEDFIRPGTMEDRIYRLRCVEAWSMVIPWYGFALKDVIDRADPLGSARYVEFKTLLDPEQMPGQQARVLDWPYVEGLRLDEARHPLTILATGVYGQDLPNQNGAPIRLIVPWKYGFKGIKSIVSMTFTEQEPFNSWKRSASHEYGFYANVNPEVNHPRWSQARERRLGPNCGVFSCEQIPTMLFNGYVDQVAGLYAGMDLRVYY
ncbi:MAG: protein-methionine-sulfoxide reductase catalytic subunit MsrP [Gemmatimonadota bacterium]|nr:protein-methionine-sulfoxide reductase catalytic subunit MsrP [Gemmatimonadota bacterium]